MTSNARKQRKYSTDQWARKGGLAEMLKRGELWRSNAEQRGIAEKRRGGAVMALERVLRTSARKAAWRAWLAKYSRNDEYGEHPGMAQGASAIRERAGLERSKWISSPKGSAYSRGPRKPGWITRFKVPLSAERAPLGKR